MNNKVKFKGPMKHFMRWPLYLSVLVVLLDLLVFIVSVKAGNSGVCRYCYLYFYRSTAFSDITNR